jgi:hypothetical protein
MKRHSGDGVNHSLELVCDGRPLATRQLQRLHDAMTTTRMTETLSISPANLLVHCSPGSHILFNEER